MALDCQGPAFGMPDILQGHIAHLNDQLRGVMPNLLLLLATD